jgi:signal peptidase I
MEVQRVAPGPAARKGFWVAIVLGSLYVLATMVTPIAGATCAGIFFAVAWGIRRGQPWAAITGAGVLALPVVLPFLRWVSASSRDAALGVGVLVSLGVAVLCGFFFVRAAREAALQLRAVPALPIRQLRWPWVVLLVLDAAFWLCIRLMVIPTGAMEDTLLIGDSVFVEVARPHLGRSPEWGELVVFHYPVDRTQTYVKRIAGVPGDRLRIQNKQLYRNGLPVSETYARHKTDYVDSYRDNFPSPPNVPVPAPWQEMLTANARNGELVVPEGKYFVLGDNRDNSFDSRYWGYISRDDVIGTPVLIYASHDIGPPGTEGRGAPTLFNTRWNRLLRRP